MVGKADDIGDTWFCALRLKLPPDPSLSRGTVAEVFIRGTFMPGVAGVAPVETLPINHDCHIYFSNSSCKESEETHGHPAAVSGIFFDGLNKSKISLQR